MNADEGLRYEYAVAYHSRGAAGTKTPRTLEKWGTDMRGCLAAYHEMRQKDYYADVGIVMRQVSGWSKVDDPEVLWRE